MIAGRGVNLVIRAADGSDRLRPIGKLIHVGGKLVYHDWRPTRIRLNNWSVGINRALIEHLKRHDVQEILLYFPDRQITYETTVDFIEAFGIAGAPWVWGQDLNLAWTLWDVVNAHPNVPVIAKAARQIVHQVPPVPEGVIVRPLPGDAPEAVPEAAPPPAQPQLALIEEAS